MYQSSWLLDEPFRINGGQNFLPLNLWYYKSIHVACLFKLTGNTDTNSQRLWSLTFRPSFRVSNIKQYLSMSGLPDFWTESSPQLSHFWLGTDQRLTSGTICGREFTTCHTQVMPIQQEVELLAVAVFSIPYSEVSIVASRDHIKASIGREGHRHHWGFMALKRSEK